MKALKYLTYVGKLAEFVSALNVIPFVDPAAEKALELLRKKCEEM